MTNLMAYEGGSIKKRHQTKTEKTKVKEKERVETYRDIDWPGVMCDVEGQLGPMWQ